LQEPLPLPWPSRAGAAFAARGAHGRGIRPAVSAFPQHAPFTLSGEVLTRRAVTAVTAAAMVISFAFSLGNVTRLSPDLGITVWIAWLVGPAVDLSVIGLLVGMRFLSLHGYKDDELAGLHRMLGFCGLLTLALNTVGAISHRQYGTALVDAVGPSLVIGWRSGPEAAAPDLRRLPGDSSRTFNASRSGSRAADNADATCPATGPCPGARRRAPRRHRQAHQWATDASQALTDRISTRYLTVIYQ
jgi:hypothetical protein